VSLRIRYSSSVEHHPEQKRILGCEAQRSWVSRSDCWTDSWVGPAPLCRCGTRSRRFSGVGGLQPKTGHPPVFTDSFNPISV
jgi:hypothetical protein